MAVMDFDDYYLEMPEPDAADSPTWSIEDLTELSQCFLPNTQPLVVLDNLAKFTLEVSRPAWFTMWDLYIRSGYQVRTRDDVWWRIGLHRREMQRDGLRRGYAGVPAFGPWLCTHPPQLKQYALSVDHAQKWAELRSTQDWSPFNLTFRSGWSAG